MSSNYNHSMGVDDDDSLDLLALDFKKGHEHNMPCMKAIGLVLARVKELRTQGHYSSPEAAERDLCERIRGLPAYKKRGPTIRKPSRPSVRKRGTKNRSK